GAVLRVGQYRLENCLVCGKAKIRQNDSARRQNAFLRRIESANLRVEQSGISRVSDLEAVSGEQLLGLGVSRRQSTCVPPSSAVCNIGNFDSKITLDLTLETN